MAAVLKHWREAASLILISRASVLASKYGNLDGQKNTHPLGQYDTNYEALIMRRSTKSTFMPSIHVFPGGIADDSDFSKNWLELFAKVPKHGLDSTTQLLEFWKRGGEGVHMFSRKREEAFSSLASEIAFRICAIRETFEECGVLLARTLDNTKKENIIDLCSQFSSSVNLSPTDLNEWRKRVNEDSYQFFTMCTELNVVPDIWTLHEWSNWLTPVSELLVSRGRRYDTAFFIALIEEKPVISQDKRETESAMWAKPVEILQDFTKQTITLAPPQLYELSRLLSMKDFEELKKYNVERQQRVQQFFPVRYNFPDRLCYVLTGDSLYPSVPDHSGTDTPELHSEEPFSEVAKKFPNRNCTQIVVKLDDNNNPKSPRMELLCNISAADGHLPPVTGLSEKMLQKSSL